jgi:hypothetical protein
MFLIYFLIALFLLLIIYQIFYFTSQPVIEGLENEESTTTAEYQPYNVNDPNNALILAQTNAGNISVLKGRVDNLDGLKEKVDQMQQNIDSIQVQMNDLVQQQADFAQDLAGPTPPDVSGTEGQTTADAEQFIQEDEE